MHGSIRPNALAGSCAAILVAGSFPVHAQVDEILVTAQRREAALQDVPLAVSAFDAGQIALRQIDAVKDIGQNVPNLQTYTVTAGAQAMQVHARGASIQNPGFNLSESPVGIYLDDVYFGRMASANLDLEDVERIEVLRGPQGTLYGRNTIAGAIKVVTRTPGDDRWANASLGLGNYQTTKFTGSVGGPLMEGSLAGSVSVLYEQRNGGWQPNPVTGRDAGEYDNRAARAKLHWYGSDNFKAVLSVWGVDVKNDGYNAVPQVPFANDDLPGDAENFLPAPAGSAPLGDFYANFNQEGVNYGESDQAGASLALEYGFGGVTFRSITGYASIEDRFGFDLAGGGFLGIAGAQGLLISSDSEMDQFSQEFQLLGDAFGNRLQWLAGVYYLNEDGSQTFGGDLGAFGDFVERIDSETDSYAVFAEATWRFGEALSVTAGLRWTEDDKKYSDDCLGSFCFDDSDFDAPTPDDASVALEDDWSEVTAKLGVDYRLSENALVYLSWAQGYQSGGFRTLCLGNLSSSCGATAFDPQTVDSFELGYKADLFDRRLRFNANLFYAMYEDIQQIVVEQFELPGGGENTSFPITNIGEVDVYGLELELVWAPIDRLNVFASLGIQESDFGRVDPASPPGGLNDNAPPTKELPSNPAWQGKIGFDYTIPLARNLEFFYGIDVFHSDSYFSEARNLVEIDDYTRVNGFVGLGTDDRAWQVILSGKNVTDEETYVSGIFAQGFTNIRTVAPPAEYMLTLRLSF